MNPSTELATWLVEELVARDVEQVVLCPGSRNAPLSFALAAHPAITLHTRIDERTAAFLALGMAKTSHRPAAVVTTSGTATANLHPAVLEAAHAGVMLVAITADRPAVLRGTGSNQTTDQVRLYGDAAGFVDLDRPDSDGLDAAWLAGGPVQLNVQLTEPLVPPPAEEPGRRRRADARALQAEGGRDAVGDAHDSTAPPGEERPAQVGRADAEDALGGPGLDPPDGAPGSATVAGKASEQTALHMSRSGTLESTARNGQLDGPERATRLPSGPRTVVVAGDDAGPSARLLAEAGNWPLLAEPSSGARNGENPIRTYRLLLGTLLGERIERAVVCGHPTLSRPVSRMLGRRDVEVVSVRARGRWPGRPFPVDAEHDAVAVQGADDRAWLEEWRAADRELSQRIDDLVGAEPGLTPYDVAAAVNAAVPDDGLLYVGASNPIRDLDLMARPYAAGRHHKVLANRGLAGIDGTLSGAIGAALARPRTTRAIAYVGDVTFLHDSNALVIGPDEQRPDLTIVVANDDGGSIFATLEQGAPEYAASYDKLFGTPHGVDLAALCAATGTPHRRVDDRGALATALATPTGGIEVVEAVVRRDNRRELDGRIRALATG